VVADWAVKDIRDRIAQDGKAGLYVQWANTYVTVPADAALKVLAEFPPDRRITVNANLDMLFVGWRVGK
jgi:hypothetical protein